MGNAEALGHVLAHRLPQQGPVLHSRGCGHGQHRGKDVVPQGEEVWKGGGGETAAQPTREELSEGARRRGLRVKASEGAGPKGGGEPGRPAVQQVQLLVHALNQGGVEGLAGIVRQGRPHAPPLVNAGVLGALELAEGARRVPAHGLPSEGRHGHRADRLVQGQLKRLLQVLRRLEGLVVDGAVEAPLVGRARY